MTNSKRWPHKFRLFGVEVSRVDYDSAVESIIDAAQNDEGGIVSCQAVHAVITASGDPELREKVNSFAMVTPDGQPVRWAMNLIHKAGLTERVYGPELMLRVCEAAAAKGVEIYLYGGSEEVAVKLQQRLRKRLPNLKIAGCESPPFRPLTEQEKLDTAARINDSGAGILFVGLGAPKQDIYAYENRESIRPVMVCVGAAFDFHAGEKSMAPGWMQRNGLEWLFRLASEPRRLWKRYLVTNSIFLLKLGQELCRKGFTRKTAA